MALSVGPGIFLVGGTIGTGSVTAMAKAGSQFGMKLLWVLFISCLFLWVLTEAYGRFTVVTGDTALHGFRKRLKGGNVIALLTMIGAIIGLFSAMMGIMGLTSNMIYEGLIFFIPGLDLPQYGAVLGIAVIVILIMYALLWVGRYSFFEKMLVIFVAIMGTAFLISMFIVLPSPKEIIAGFIPRIPNVKGGKLMTAAFVGTTMAGQIFVTRPLIIRAKGWTRVHVHEQSRDAFTAAFLTFVLSGSIMCAATGALFHQGKVITNVLDMVYTLEPVVGKYATAIFLVGTLSAALSSVFPIMMFPSLLVSDFRTGVLDTKSADFRIIAGVTCLFGLIVPILGTNPIIAQIATQVSMVFVLPLVIAAIFFLVNSKKNMGEHKAGILLNLGMITAFIFACVISYTAVLGLVELFVG